MSGCRLAFYNQKVMQTRNQDKKTATDILNWGFLMLMCPPQQLLSRMVLSVPYNERFYPAGFFRPARLDIFRLGQIFSSWAGFVVLSADCAQIDFPFMRGELLRYGLRTEETNLGLLGLLSFPYVHLSLRNVV